jgi:uncharacterized membrane protein YkgB
MHPRFDAIDRRIASWMNRVGHPVHRVTLGLFFVWLGLLKQFGYKTGSSLLAHTVYFGSPETMVPILGWWEVAIGATLLFPATVRISIVLMAARVPGTVLALVLKPDVCFFGAPWAPTPEGQYLIKDLMLLGAAMVIGGSVRAEHAADTPQEAEETRA